MKETLDGRKDLTTPANEPRRNKEREKKTYRNV